MNNQSNILGTEYVNHGFAKYMSHSRLFNTNLVSQMKNVLFDDRLILNCEIMMIKDESRHNESFSEFNFENYVLNINRKCNTKGHQVCNSEDDKTKSFTNLSNAQIFQLAHQLSIANFSSLCKYMYSLTWLGPAKDCPSKTMKPDLRVSCKTHSENGKKYLSVFFRPEKCLKSDQLVILYRFSILNQRKERINTQGGFKKIDLKSEYKNCGFDYYIELDELLNNSIHILSNDILTIYFEAELIKPKKNKFKFSESDFANYYQLFVHKQTSAKVSKSFFNHRKATPVMTNKESHLKIGNSFLLKQKPALSRRAPLHNATNITNLNVSHSVMNVGSTMNLGNIQIGTQHVET